MRPSGRTMLADIPAEPAADIPDAGGVGWPIFPPAHMELDSCDHCAGGVQNGLRVLPV